jgi:hypothetical protein
MAPTWTVISSEGNNLLPRRPLHWNELKNRRLNEFCQFLAEICLNSPVECGVLIPTSRFSVKIRFETEINEKELEMLKHVITSALLAMILMLGINASAADLPKQKICPLMIEEEIDPEDFEVVNYKGVKILMCCSTCKKMWAQNPDYYAVVSVKEAPQLKAVASKEIKPMKQLFCPVYTDTRVHPKSPSMEYEGKKIYFCKDRAKKRFEANPAKYAKNLK